MDSITTPASIDENGKLQLQHRESFAATIACFPNTVGILKFEPHRNRISANQRKYFYGVIIDLLHAFFVSTGERPEEILKAHVMDMLKDRFLFREKMCPIQHKYIKTYISLSNNEGSMTHQEFTEKKDAIQDWGKSVLGIDIPEPCKEWRMFKKNKEDAKS